jgi:hypothetical protein
MNNRNTNPPARAHAPAGTGRRRLASDDEPPGKDGLPAKTARFVVRREPFGRRQSEIDAIPVGGRMVAIDAERF